MNPLCEVMTATPRRALRRNRAGIQPSRSKTIARAGSPGAGAVRSGASARSAPSTSRAGRMSASSACVMVGSGALFRHRKGLPPRALIQWLVEAGRQSLWRATECLGSLPLRPEEIFTCPSTHSVAQTFGSPASQASARDDCQSRTRWASCPRARTLRRRVFASRQRSSPRMQPRRADRGADRIVAIEARCTERTDQIRANLRVNTVHPELGLAVSILISP